MTVAAVVGADLRVIAKGQKEGRGRSLERWDSARKIT